LQAAKEGVEHAAKKTAIKAETAADSTAHEARGFGARLFGRGKVGAQAVSVHDSCCWGVATICQVICIMLITAAQVVSCAHMLQAVLMMVLALDLISGADGFN
jgi:hypothetical protein